MIKNIKTKERIGLETYPVFIVPFKHQGTVLDIDYERKIISLRNTNTNKVEELYINKFIERLKKLRFLVPKFKEELNINFIKSTGYKENKSFEDIKVGQYLKAITIGEWFREFRKDNLIFKYFNDVIFRINFYNEKPDLYY